MSSHRSYDRPRMIDSFQGKHVRDIACGSCHSAVITSNGELYCWGLGDHGRLGHGDTATQTKPKQAREDSRCEILLVSVCVLVIHRYVLWRRCV